MTRILLAVSASASIYKACDLTSRLTQAGDEVRVVLTAHAAQLISPQLFEAVGAVRAHTSEFGPERETAMDHIELARWAQLFVVAPATAACLGRFAGGLAEDLISTLVLAMPPVVPRLLCPAMNSLMYTNPAVLRNLETLRADGWHVMEPDSGRLACAEEGPGRLPDPERIAERLRALAP